MKKHIIREIPDEQADLEYYFEGYGLTEKADDYCDNVFIVSSDRHGVSGFNIDEYKRIREKAMNILDGFFDVENGYTDYNGDALTYEMILKDEDINIELKKDLIEWTNGKETSEPVIIAEFLSIITGNDWKSIGIHGYSQGDYVDVIYCPKFTLDNTAEILGNVFLGCAKEFVVQDIDGDGYVDDQCFGYIVANCEVNRNEDYKRIVCEQAGIEESETQLELIVDSYTKTLYTYATF